MLQLYTFLFISIFILPHSFAQTLTPYNNRLTSPITYKNHTSFFAHNYYDSKKRFLDYHKEFKSLSIDHTPLRAQTNSNDLELTIDGYYIPGKNTKKLLIVTSGIHGTEAFTGSLLQDFFIQYLLSQKQPAVSILLIHAINPYGFKYFRRTNANNVDLNRNFADSSEFQSQNDSYEKLTSLYTIDTKASSGILPQLGFYISAIINYLKHGKKILLQSLSGQYKHKDGLFYGGMAPEIETIAVQNWLTTFLKNKTHTVHIDIHTGFGKKNILHLYGSDEYTQPEQLLFLKKIFPNAHIDTGSDSDFYPTKGDFVDWTWKSHPQQIVVPMVFEFGTINSQTFSGGLKSLWTMVVENQSYHNGYNIKADHKAIRKNFENLFNPQDPLWQKHVATQGLDQLIDVYTKLEQWH